MLYEIRVEPLRRDVTRKEVERVFGDFGNIYRVTIHRKQSARYNKISKKKDILNACYAIISYTDSYPARIAQSNLDNTLHHPITKKYHSIVEVVQMGAMPIRRSLRVTLNNFD